ncbi:MAG TPA: class I SAM-dependent methyltransferase [Candidatus Limnocylindrales bacterium]|nr:class I SAM-dependent methyltransferase [Candidatus Limnocylindrales bacterium]
MPSLPDYELIDAGDGRRLERLGARLVDRPAPGADEPRREPGAWDRADLRFEAATGWVGEDRKPWSIEVDGIDLQLEPGSGGQVGFFPEHAGFWPWLRERARESDSTPVLNLFAATGATTLALAAGGTAVTHVDSARGAVSRARRNAELSGLVDRPVRWIVDDALAFVRREARRGRTYAGAVLDPPTFGHGRGGERWELVAKLPQLLDAVAEVLTDEGYLLLTAHTTGLEPQDLARVLRMTFGPGPDITTEWIELSATSGATLRLGTAARMIRR